MIKQRKSDRSGKKARFDTRLSVAQKDLFEQAAQLKGYKSLSDFVIQVVQDAAYEIIEQNEIIIASEKDKLIFFKALENPPRANTNLKNAFKDYKSLTKGK